MWSISPIGAVFEPSGFCTDYTVKVAATNTNSNNTQWKVSWSIALILVDPAGTADPSQPGSAAAVDTACDNNGNGVRSSHLSNATLYGVPSSELDSFTWYHRDPASAPPGFSPGVLHCDHSKQGPRGHQGLIKVVVQHGAQQCFASFEGTHTGSSTDAGQPGKPDCTRT